MKEKKTLIGFDGTIKDAQSRRLNLKSNYRNATVSPNGQVMAFDYPNILLRNTISEKSYVEVKSVLTQKRLQSCRTKAKSIT
jgi:hypothetical protein